VNNPEILVPKEINDRKAVLIRAIQSIDAAIGDAGRTPESPVVVSPPETSDIRQFPDFQPTPLVDDSQHSQIGEIAEMSLTDLSEVAKRFAVTPEIKELIQ